MVQPGWTDSPEYTGIRKDVVQRLDELELLVRAVKFRVVSVTASDTKGRRECPGWAAELAELARKFFIKS